MLLLRLVARVACAAALAAGGLVVAAGTPALACVPDDVTGQCVPPTQTYHVDGTDGTLAVQRDPKVGDPVRWLREGDAVAVVCQINNGGADPDDGLASRTWDLVAGGGWVYDHFVTTPPQGADGFSPGVRHCSPTTGSPGGGYHVQGTDGTLTVQGRPAVDHVVGSLREGDPVQVVCQVNDGGADPYDGLTSRTWDRIGDNRWVYDWFVSTPPQGADGYSPGIPHCSATQTPGPTGYRIQGTDGSLSVQSRPETGHVVATLREGAAVSVICQVNNGGADPYDGLTSRTWDKIGDNRWVYDWFVSTPQQGTDGFSPGVPHCDSAQPPAVDTSVPFVALGDSYAAGLGTYDHSGFSGDNCDRSDKTYSMVAANSGLPTWLGGAKPVILACSEARTGVLTQVFKGHPPQIDQTGGSSPLGAKTRLVTLTLGGNDVDFAGILNRCMGSPTINSCFGAELDKADAFIDDFEWTLVATYDAVRIAAPKAHVVVLTYPQIFPETGPFYCGLSLGVIDVISDTTLKRIRGTWSRLNAVIKAAAAVAGVSVLDVEDAFKGHDFCAGSPYANGLPLSWPPDKESYHPTVAGYAEEGRRLADLVRSTWP
ncbi:GDSL-type esterase/lipase family protein [Microbispora sp. ATCC PTA-5024]|uniref:GDSL-type esterase/lipase family protein n=1 Tax=Microbispora sp. ATCC PTA-5024 TaxID=316330 RepID=UPI00041E2C5E|nr:GDSL-type esterase/lipase family protein [Microbispora sp. ATCC PTA-5024]